MARPTYWKRQLQAEFYFPTAPRTFWNEVIFDFAPGETLTRTVGNYRAWIEASKAGAVTIDTMACPYVWMLVWDDGSVPGMQDMQPFRNMDVLKEHIIHVERHQMRDVYTPAKASIVTYGWQDDRASTAFDTSVQRRSTPVAPKVLSQLRFIAQANPNNWGIPMNWTPRLMVNCLVKTPALLPWEGMRGGHRWPCSKSRRRAYGSAARSGTSACTSRANSRRPPSPMPGRLQ